MNLDDAKVLAELHMQAHGLLQQGWTFRFDKATRAQGAEQRRTGRRDAIGQGAA